MADRLSYAEAYANYKASIQEVTSALEDFGKLRGRLGLPDYVPAIAHGEDDPIFLAWKRVEAAQARQDAAAAIFDATPEPPP